MEKKYQRFRERKIRRRKAFGVYITILAIEMILALIAVFNLKEFSAIPLVAFFLSYAFGFLYLISRPWAVENYETRIFVDVCDASSSLELVSDEDKDNPFYFGKASKKLEEAILNIARLADKFEQMNSALVKRFVEPLRSLKKNLETRILPRISEHKERHDMTSVLHGLAQIFGEEMNPISIEEIISKNKDLERFTEAKVDRKPSQYKLFMSREPVKATGIITLSLLFDFLIVYIHSKLFQYDLWTKLSDLTTFVTVLAFGTAIGAIVYEIAKSRR